MRIAVGLVAVLLALACGGTRDAVNGNGTGGDGAGADPDAGADDGSVPPPMSGIGGGADGLAENDPCLPDAGECGEGLDCTALPTPYSGVCGRACTTDADCTEADEVCASYLDGSVSICINLVEPWDIYQFDQTSFCDETSSPIEVTDAPPELRGGLCIQVCLLPGADTSTLTQAEIDSLQTCEGSQECMELLSADSTGARVVGACATPVERGESCDAVDAVCRNLEEDVCFPLDPTSATSPLFCFQNCSTSVTCETGTCDPIPGSNGGALCDWIDSGGG